MELTQPRYDDTTFGKITKNTKNTKGHEENLVSLFDWSLPLAAPRFARWQE